MRPAVGVCPVSGPCFEDGRVLQAARLFEEQVGGFESLLGTPPT